MTIKQALNKQISLLRNEYFIKKYPDIVDKKCIECDKENYKFAVINNLSYEQINFEKLGILNPYHKASLVGFNTNPGTIWYILDPTYGQFLENEKFKKYMFSNHKEFCLKLLNNGYIECTKSNFLRYISGFIYSGAYITNINENEVHKNVKQLLLDNKIKQI